jgi:hypothetical protein
MLLQYDQRRLPPPAAGTAPATRHDALHTAYHAAVQILARTRVAMCHAVGRPIAYGCVSGASRAARRDTFTAPLLRLQGARPCRLTRIPRYCLITPHKSHHPRLCSTTFHIVVGQPCFVLPTPARIHTLCCCLWAIPCHHPPRNKQTIWQGQLIMVCLPHMITSHVSCT